MNNAVCISGFKISITYFASNKAWILIAQNWAGLMSRPKIGLQ